MNKVVPKWVIVVNHPAKEITCKPSPVIFKISLILQVWCAVYFGKVRGLKVFCTGIHLSDLTHGHHHRFHFIHQRMDKGAITPAVWEPESIQSAEARCGKRFVYRGIILNPWK